MRVKKKSACVLCVNACGLSIEIENNRIVKVRGNKEDPRSQGYTCRKALQMAYHQHNPDRLLHPLKKVGDSFRRISWEQAISEIAEKLKDIVDKHGPRSLALAGGMNVGNAAQMPFAMGFLAGMGSQYRYNSLAQELTGRFWVNGETYGAQGINPNADVDNADMAIISGKNPMMSHHFDRARLVWKKFGKDPEKVLVVIDPRKSETAKLADIHLAIRPGTDALLLRAMIAITLQEGWQDQAFIDKHVSDFDSIRHLFEDFDGRAALDVCELDYDQVKEVCKLFTSMSACHLSDLGTLMGRHSTLVSWLENVLLTVTGRLGKIGGNLIRPGVVAMRRNPDAPEPELWRTVATGYRQIAGIYPPNVLPEEIVSDHPDRIRAVIVSAHNPLRSWADTSAYEEAFESLDLLVTIDIVMSETAALSQYVLPSCSGYEKWDEHLTGGGTAFRAPILEPEGEQLEEGEILTRLADALCLIPEIPESLNEAAESGDLEAYGSALGEFVKETPEAAPRLLFIIAKTLGRHFGSAHLASLWGRLRAMPHEAGKKMFQATLDQTNDIAAAAAAAAGPASNELPELPTADGKVRLNLPEMIQWIEEVDPTREREEFEKEKAEFPFILSSGRHFDFNANTQMRNPEWNKGKRVCTLIMHPIDAEKHQLRDGQMVKVLTEGGEEKLELEVDSTTREGYIMVPHGFGLVHEGKVYGANANRLAKSSHRDRLAGTPQHRYIPCRVEAAA
jgi:anaerobic selenocysteine-containing dehydrogenase